MKDKVDIFSFKPTMVSSNMIRSKAGGFRVISAEEAARCALDKLSFETESTGSWKHIVFLRTLGFFQ